MQPGDHAASRPPLDEARPFADGDVGDTSLVDPRRLMVFRTVGREGSLAAAARALGWTQPAVSQQVHRLERDLGLPLIARAGRGIVLTEPGLTLLTHADSVALSLQAADRAMADLAGLRAGRVRIAAFPSASATFVADATRTLAATYPGIDVRLSQHEPPEAEALLASGDCDIAVVFRYQEDSMPAEGAFTSTALLSDDLRVVLPANHRLRDRSSIGLTDLQDERWITGCPRCRHHLLISTSQVGFTPDVRHSTDDYVVVQSLVAADVAVAILPSLALTASRNTAVHARPIAGHAPRLVSALTVPASEQTPAVATALQHLQGAAAHHSDDTVN